MFLPCGPRLFALCCPFVVFRICLKSAALVSDFLLLLPLLGGGAGAFRLGIKGPLVATRSRLASSSLSFSWVRSVFMLLLGVTVAFVCDSVSRDNSSCSAMSGCSGIPFSRGEKDRRKLFPEGFGGRNGFRLAGCGVRYRWPGFSSAAASSTLSFGRLLAFCNAPVIPRIIK